MKKIYPIALLVLIISGCSAPKYSYHFDHFDYNSGKKNPVAQTETQSVTPSTNDQAIPEVGSFDGITPLSEETLTASSSNEVIALAPTVSPLSTTAKEYKAMSRPEKKAFRKALKSEIKTIIQAKKEGKKGLLSKEAKALDGDLKLAIIFGAVALTLSFFGGANSVFYVLSVVSLVVAIVFLIKWLAEL